MASIIESSCKFHSCHRFSPSIPLRNNGSVRNRPQCRRHNPGDLNLRHHRLRGLSLAVHPLSLKNELTNHPTNQPTGGVNERHRRWNKIGEETERAELAGGFTMWDSRLKLFVHELCESENSYALIFAIDHCVAGLARQRSQLCRRFRLTTKKRLIFDISAWLLSVSALLRT